MKILCVLALLSLIAVCVKGSNDVIDMKNYELMPPLHKHDSYLDCTKKFREKAVYCVAKTYIKPDNNSEVWRYIKEFSSYKIHFFRHDTVTRGVCMNRCEKQLTQQKPQQQRVTLTFDIDSAIYHPGIELHATTKEQRIVYHEAINRCVNQEMLNEYGLESWSEIEFCNTNESESFSIDLLDFFALVVVLSLIALTLIGSLYDAQLRDEGGKNPEHYRKFPINSNRTLLAFSVVRNWNQLVNHPEPVNNNRPPADDFTYFESIKIIVMLGNTVVHIFSILSMLPSMNHDVLETNSQNFIHKIFSGATFTNQIYLAIAGFLLTLGPAKQIKQGKVLTTSDFWDALKKRYLRLTPLHAFAILMEATWVSKAYNGPIWAQLAGQERASCRANWWTNLLYINNFVGAGEPCILPTWYLATDMQLFIMRFILLAIISRIPRRKSLIFSTSLFITFLIPGYIVYKYHLDGLYVGTVEAARYFYRHENSYKYFHIPFYASMGSYIFGMLTAFIYREVKDNNIDVKKSKLFMFLWNSVVPLILFGIFGAPYIFSTYEFQKPAWWITFYGAFHRNMWGWMLGVIILGYSAGMGGQWKDFFNASVFRPLGKINFGFYLTHITMIKLILGDMYEPHYMSLIKIVWLVLATTGLSYLSGAAVHVLVELPAANLQKEWESKPKVVDKNGNGTVKSVNGFHSEIKTTNGSLTKKDS
ncbi:nose resistant to fluoxetine protein 6-like [Culicoides brevitarsis]|uniref:nose resistant to fluoxetine protein 6-like n=1 Tax=Culicoides brevitarsis TaxID=469753 RepID=UPI00307B7C81